MRYKYKNSWTSKENGVVIEKGIKIVDSSNGRSFRYGLPKTLWDKTDDEKAQWCIGQISDTYAQEEVDKIIEDAAKIAEPVSEVTKKEINKEYDI